MTRFKIQKISFDTRTQENSQENASLNAELQNQWSGHEFEYDFGSDAGVVTEDIIRQEGDSLISFLEFTDWLFFEATLKVLDVEMSEPAVFVEEWSIPAEFAEQMGATAPIQRKQVLTIC